MIKKEVNTIKVLISADANVYEIVNSNSNAGYRLIELKDRYNNRASFWVKVDASEFGNIGTSGTKVSISQNTNDKEIDAIIQRVVSTDLKGTLPGGNQVDTSIYTLTSVYKVAGQLYVDLTDFNGNKASYKYYGLKSDLEIKALEGKVRVTTQTIFGEKAVVELERATGVVVDRTALNAAILAGEATSTAGKTDASRIALENAIAAGKLVRDNANATQTDVNNAATAITNAIAGLVNEGTVTITEADAITSELGFGMFGVKITLPAGISSAKIVKVDANVQEVTVNNGSYTTVAGTYNKGNNVITIEFIVDGTTKTVTITK